MIKQEINEIKRLFTPNSCSITRICGCYVDGEKNKKLILRKHFFLFLKKKSSNILNCSGKLFPEALARIC